MLETAFQSVQDSSLVVGKNYIDGEWRESRSNQRFQADIWANPANNQLLGTSPESNVDDVEDAILAAQKALPAWKSKSGRERARILRRWFDLIIEHKEDLAKIISTENGKAQADAAGEVGMCAGFLEWFSEEAARIHGDVAPHSNPTFRINIIKEPIGVCAMILPWNFPAAMMVRKLAASLAAGCPSIAKPDGLTPFSASAFAVLAERAGIPTGVFNLIHALENTPAVGKALCEHPLVRKLSFTGSTRVGKILLAQSASNVQKLSLELGGNAPFLVLDDADLEVAVSSLVVSKFKVSGQTCVCANRIYVQEGIHDQFVEKLLTAVRAFKLGPASDVNTTQGPLINANAVAKSKDHVEDAISKGGKVLVGGRPASELGPNFFQPTVIVNATQNMKIAHEETFGPVAAIFKFKTDEEGIQYANDADVGLASYLMTTGHDRVRAFSEGLQAGMVAVNTGVIADPASPFGGIKNSGFGREGSKYGLDEYLTLKTIVTGGFKSIV
ncbi:aldehyde dehydrogenase [Aaosphaeria arxii CBS 175.79]|uniref:succinate-semialdehyde dehydrogenase [NAD(P)(+)] n=1 Tax=Aaosphaeria arxii CBS 175.79 TaxID=1450172 RepID=A0A6A5XFW7_9PLEO|nr:aldehyde dehydrogenase [Aaosphaeria arxii CBS 175.79]KAF2011823.1 aldehyde dehydrogenase [Aaosphaeria arxii CBS 175.79]